MVEKFAVLSNIKNKNEIPIKYKIIKNNPRLFDWYIKKFNPYKIEEIVIENFNGYNFTMPFTDQEFSNNSEIVSLILDKMLKIFDNYNVLSIYSKKKYFSNEINIYQATGKYLMPFFLTDVLKRIENMIQKNLKNIEILIISGDNFLTELILDNIYLDLNYIGILIDDRNLFNYKEKSKEIFEDSGLNISVVESLSIISTADIIINTSDPLLKYENFFKRGSVYIDMSTNTVRLKDLYIRRDDIFLVSDFKIKIDKKKYNLNYFELLFYSNSKNYREMISKKYKSYYFKRIINELSNLKVSFSSFLFFDSILDEQNFSKYLNNKNN